MAHCADCNEGYIRNLVMLLVSVFGIVATTVLLISAVVVTLLASL